MHARRRFLLALQAGEAERTRATARVDPRRDLTREWIQGLGRSSRRRRAACHGGGAADERSEAGQRAGDAVLWLRSSVAGGSPRCVRLLGPRRNQIEAEVGSRRPGTWHGGRAEQGEEAAGLGVIPTELLQVDGELLDGGGSGVPAQEKRESLREMERWRRKDAEEEKGGAGVIGARERRAQARGARGIEELGRLPRSDLDRALRDTEEAGRIRLVEVRQEAITRRGKRVAAAHG